MLWYHCKQNMNAYTHVAKLYVWSMFSSCKLASPQKKTTYGLIQIQTGWTSIHLTCGKIVSLVHDSNNIDEADQTCHSHHVSLQHLQRKPHIWSNSNTHWLNKPTFHMWQSCKSGQWSENNKNLRESLHTHSKIVSLVNSHKLTLTSFIKLMKHVIIIMIACTPSKEERGWGN